MPPSPNPSPAILVLVTCPAAASEDLSSRLVEEGLVACVNIIGNVTSVYSWQGRLCSEPEQLLVLKTGRALWEALRDRIKELHSYEVPEIICLPIEDGYKPYMDWMNSVLSQGK